MGAEEEMSGWCTGGVQVSYFQNHIPSTEMVSGGNTFISFYLTAGTEMVAAIISEIIGHFEHSC